MKKGREWWRWILMILLLPIIIPYIAFRVYIMGDTFENLM